MADQKQAEGDERRGSGGGLDHSLPIDARARTIARAVLAIVLVAIATWVASDFLPALAWAAVIAITTWPIYRRLAAKLGGTNRVVPALIFTLGCGFVILVPVSIALHQIALAGDAFVGWLSDLQKGGVPVPGWLSQLPLAGSLIASWWQTNLTDPETIARWLRSVDLENIGSWSRSLGGELMHRIFLFAVTLIALFFMFRDGKQLADSALRASNRIWGEAGSQLADKLSGAVRGTVNGTIIIAVAEGVTIGIGYLVAGAPNTVLLTLLTVAFAMLPLGAEIAVSLVVLLMLAQGASFLTAILLLGFGFAVTIIGDNLLWPALVGQTARLPFLMALIGVLGGVQSFGLIGLFLGPVIMAALMTVWQEWIAERSR